MATAGAPRRPKRRNNRRILFVSAIVIVAAWAIWAKTHPAADASAGLITAKVTRADLVESVSATGSVTAQTGAQVKIGSQITGRIKRLYADVGSSVKAGQVIAVLDLPDIDAQLAQAEANLAAAQTHLQQQLSGVGMERTQTSTSISQARANLRAAQARYRSAVALSRQQSAQTPTDIARAKNALAAARAALSTAKSSQAQVVASVNLQVSTANESLNQASATAHNAVLNLNRQKELLHKGFVAASIVDAAQATTDVNKSQVEAARQNVDLVKAKVAADLQAAADGVTQAQQSVASAQSALTAAQTGTYTDQSKIAEVQSARADVGTAQAALSAALGNGANDTLKQQDVQASRDAMRAAQAQVDYNRAQLNKTFIRSPISGTVTQLASQQGETLAAGLSAPTLIIVTDLKRLQVDAYVDETDIGKLRMGQLADVTVDAFPKRIFKGKVTKVASGSTIQAGVVTYDVTITLDANRGRLKPDMTASVTVHTGMLSNVIVVPTEAVKMSARGYSVNVLTTKDGKQNVVKRKVKTGGTDGTNTEIRTGLKEGETVITAGYDEKRGGASGGSSPFGAPAGGGGRGGR